MHNDSEYILFYLLRLGLGFHSDYSLPSSVSWAKVIELAERGNVLALAFDGLQKVPLPSESSAIGLIPRKEQLLDWYGQLNYAERVYERQWRNAKSFGRLMLVNEVRCYVLKGFAMASLYPVPNHRACSDLDCYLSSYAKGNEIVRANGLNVDDSYYKHSKIKLDGLTIENHQFLLPVKGSSKAKKFEKMLQRLILEGEPKRIGDSELYAPSDLFQSVYILAHAQEHFFEDGINLRNLCDWGMLVQHLSSVGFSWDEWKRICTEYGLLSFGYSMTRLANRVLGVEIPFDCPEDTIADDRLLADILSFGIRVPAKKEFTRRIQLVANIVRDSWKFRLFSDTSALMFGVRRIWGYLFDKCID